MLNGGTILIVEDEALTALDLACSVEAAGGQVVGPVDKAADAIKLSAISSPAGVILDIKLADRDATEVARSLIARKTPFVFYSAAAPAGALGELAGEIPVVLKPNRATTVIGALLGRIAELKREATRR